MATPGSVCQLLVPVTQLAWLVLATPPPPPPPPLADSPWYSWRCVRVSLAGDLSVDEMNAALAFDD